MDTHSTDGTVEHIDTVVIGAGQAGLCAGHHLARHHREFVILDANDHVGDGWRRHWDSLRLYSPASHDGLPGLPFPGSPDAFPGKDEVADYLGSYVDRFDLPVRNRSVVRSVSASGAGYLVDCGDSRFQATNVVVATGTFGRTPRLPSYSADLDPRITQLHSSEYRNPAQLGEGAVLVVGASHSGTDIALELASTHPTVLCGRDPGQIPLSWRSPAFGSLFRVLWALWGTVLSTRTPAGRRMRRHARAHGAPMLRVKRRDLAAAGVDRVTDRMTGTRDGLPVLGAGRAVTAATVIWCTGFQQDFSMIDLPVFDDGGWPRERRGVVAEAPGLYFTGLCFQSSFRSMLIGGAGADAAHVVDHLVSHRKPSRALGLPLT